MLPKTFVTDRDLILSVSLSKGTFATTNVHPLYLSPAACWINRTLESSRSAKVVLVNVLKVVSSALIFGTLFAHTVRLWDPFALGLVGTAWSLTVCVALGAGIAVTATTSKLRSSRANLGLAVDPLAGVPFTHRVVVFALFCAAYVHTWIYYARCCGPEPLGGESSWTGCSERRGPSAIPLATSTALTFAWINGIGSLRMVRLR